MIAEGLRFIPLKFRVWWGDPLWGVVVLNSARSSLMYTSISSSVGSAGLRLRGLGIGGVTFLGLAFEEPQESRAARVC